MLGGDIRKTGLVPGSREWLFAMFTHYQHDLDVVTLCTLYEQALDRIVALTAVHRKDVVHGSEAAESAEDDEWTSGG